MGTTTNLGLPYPEGGDLVIQGDDAIQALAEGIEAISAPVFVRSNPNIYVPQAIGGGVTVDWQTMGGSGHFTGTTVLTYTGSKRLFFIMATVTVGIASGAAESEVSLTLGATLLTNSKQTHAASPGRATHNITTIVYLESGNTFEVGADITGGSTGPTVEAAHFAAVALSWPTA